MDTPLSSISKKHSGSDLEVTPNSKKGKVDITSAEYKKSVADLCLEWKKGRKKRSRVLIKELMEHTGGLRRKWIMEEGPMISQILKNFPPLRESRMVSERVH